ncbi:MAG: DoxX family protein [Flavobacteriales bacterium]|jgi:hypothetical protein|nr:DoxX family protein [Flavobacteriales bacterium]
MDLISFEITSILKLIIALGLLNVWVLRFNQSTSYRCGDANNMKEEFDNYGFASWFMYAIGAFKVVLAGVLLWSVFVREFTDLTLASSTQSVYGLTAYDTIDIIGLLVLSIIMIGAIIMHIKLKDSILKSLPAFLMLVMSLACVLLMAGNDLLLLL